MMATAAKMCIAEVEELVEVGQLDPDQLTADDHHILANRHPGMGCLAHEVEVGGRPGRRPDPGGKAGQHPGLALQFAGALAQHQRPHIVA